MKNVSRILPHLIALRRPQRGFTLIEMLLVLAILGILAGLVIPRLVGKGDEARKVAARTQISTFKTALNSFEIDCGFFPKGADGLQQLVTQPREADGWKGPYMEEIPLDPWKHPFVYEAPGKRRPATFDISSPGPDARPDTEDDITN